jgi:hypothetical protein
MFHFTDRDSFAKFIEDNADADYYAHNGYGYDYPVLHRLWGIDVPQQNDTLVLSRLANPSRFGGHRLRNWGSILGHPKQEHEEWDRYSPEMRSRCDRDVQITAQVLQRVRRELANFSDRSIELENSTAKIIQQQISHGWLLEEGLAFDLIATLKERKYELEDLVHQRFKPRTKAVKEIKLLKNKDGSTSRRGLGFLGPNPLDIIGGDCTRVAFVPYNLGSRQQIGEYLKHFGWKPTQFTPTGQPIVDEGTLEGVDIPEAQLIAEYLMIQKRIAMVQSWLEMCSETTRIHGYVNSCGAVTGRMTHSKPNVAHVTASGKPYGRELRSCWIVPEGYKLVGVDASGLELRMLAHYMDDDDYIETVCKGRQEHGTDIHTKNQGAAGLSTRDQAKTFIYAFLYGAGDLKIGSIVGGGRGAGKKLKSKFLQATPALSQLRTRVENAARRGHLRGLDGRKVMVRSQHAALNTLLQSAGAIVMKQALINLDTSARAAGLDFHFLGNIHDEIQTEVREDQADEFGRLAVAAIDQAGRDFNLRCPLSADYKVGNNWSETH